jgi:hypothetical protein
MANPFTYARIESVKKMQIKSVHTILWYPDFGKSGLVALILADFFLQWLEIGEQRGPPKELNSRIYLFG